MTGSVFQMTECITSGTRCKNDVRSNKTMHTPFPIRKLEFSRLSTENMCADHAYMQFSTRDWLCEKWIKYFTPGGSGKKKLTPHRHLLSWFSKQLAVYTSSSYATSSLIWRHVSGYLKLVWQQNNDLKF